MLSVDQYDAGLREDRGIRFYQTMPPLAGDEFDALRDSIRADGVTVPVIVDERGNIIDGHHRVQLARELGIDYPTRTVEGLSEAEKLAMSVSLNINRRQLTREQKRLIIASQLVAAPEKSNREHAKTFGVSHHTVSAVRDDLVATGQIAQLTHTTGADGKSRPAQRPAPEPELVVDPATGEVHDPMPTTAKSLRTDDEWKQLAQKAKAYRTPGDAHAALAPDTNYNYFRTRLKQEGTQFMHHMSLARLTEQSNDLVERLGENILSYAEGGHDALDVAALDLVDPEVTSRTLNQLAKATTEIKKLIRTLQESRS